MLDHRCRTPLRALLRRFARNEKGMTLPMVAVSFMAMTGFVGTAVDLGRIQLVQSRLSFALDAAGLAAGATLNTSSPNSEVTKYVQANFPTNYLGSSTPTTSVTLTADNTVLVLGASTNVPTTFMNVFGVSQVTVTATSQVTRTVNGLELVLVLDNTGSMSSSGKLTSLKNASTSLVNILYGSRTTVPNLWIGLVPFSQAVNIGTGYTTWMDTAFNSTLNWGPTSWMGCVDANERNGRDITDDPPSVQKIRAYYSPSTDNRPAPNNSSSQLSFNKWVRTRDTAGNPLTYGTGLGSSFGPNAYCPQKVLPMTSNKTSILNAITSMQATGNTHISLGLGWGWRMLSPRWRTLWGGEMNENNLPLDYGTPHMNKAVILLTDGENTMDNQNYTAFGYLSDGRIGSTSSSTAVSKLNNKVTSLCTSLKANGVYVYTISLGSGTTTTVKNLLKDCASAPNYYFNSPSSSELQAIFNAIGDSLSNLRVSK